MDAAQIQSQVNSNIYFNLISFTALFYEYFLTLSLEILRYWGTPLKLPTILFFANRYGTLFGTIPVVIQNFWTTESSPQKIRICQHLETYHQYFIIVTQILIGLMLLLRTYALYERSKRVLALMVFVAVASIAVAIWSVFTGKAGDSSQNLHLYVGCAYGFTKAQGISLATAWAGSGVFDFMVFVLTLRKGLGVDSRDINLLSVLLRDGSVYFGVMAMSNLSNILTFVLGSPYTRGIVTTFTNIISSLMISRLMLNLRDPSLVHSMSEGISDGTSAATGLVFAPHRGTPDVYTDMSSDIELSTRVEAHKGVHV
ncbi:hypothetical protein DFH08DRAFT_881467 [Mycena albidolilacea]|uniref:DUF6533 domain-containing protein n=1 Tax=Mycena albidolilacea TaxID=1033008 RepID=A0AAD6ZNW1_9AGAR|nr:hypothetical protein DFH08DRAFT_881467 [Mycena albidolilacea]